MRKAREKAHAAVWGTGRWPHGGAGTARNRTIDFLHDHVVLNHAVDLSPERDEVVVERNRGQDRVDECRNDVCIHAAAKNHGGHREEHGP